MSLVHKIIHGRYINVKISKTAQDRLLLHVVFNKKLRSGLSTESFLAFLACDFKFLNNFLTSFLK